MGSDFFKQTPQKMKIIVQNLAVEYLDEGVGQVLLFLHGWQDNFHTFDSLIPLLSQTRRIIRLDLPGFGKSEMPKETWDLDNYVQFVDEFIKKLGFQVYAFVGHSFGGRIIIKGGATRNLQAQKVILIGSAGIAKDRTFRNSVLKFLAKVGKVIVCIPPLIFWRRRLQKRVYDAIGSDYLNAGKLKGTFLKIISEDLSVSAKKITTPTLLIWGENDIETPLSDGEKMARLITNSELKVISGAGHFVHKEKPQEVAKLVQGFL
ncbi:MAG: alpha/beta hydrolase [Patescibacteria group bacterium]